MIGIDERVAVVLSFDQVIQLVARVLLDVVVSNKDLAGVRYDNAKRVAEPHQIDFRSPF